MSNTINFAGDVVDENNKRIPPENSEAVEKNRDWIVNEGFAEFEVTDDNDDPAWRRHNADVLNRIKFVDENGVEDEDLRAKSEEAIWEIAKNEVLRERAFDFQFMTYREDDRRKLLRAELSDSIAKTVLGVVGITPVIKKEIDGEIVAEQLAKVDAKQSVGVLDKFLSDKGKDRAEVSEVAVVGAAVRESENMSNFIGYIEKENYSQNVVTAFKKDHEIFGRKMISFFGKLYTSAVEYVANNRTRVITDTVATLATSAAFLSGAGLAAVGAYAVYSAVGAWGWPIVEKRKKAVRQAKKEGRSYEDYKLGLTFNGLRKAWKDIKSDEKEWKRYKNRAYTGAAAGVLIAGSLGALGTGLVTGVDALAARVGGTITRSLATLTSQGLNFRDARNDLKREDNAENRAAYNSAKLGLGIGMTVAALASALSIYSLDSHSGVNTSGNVKGADDQMQEATEKMTKKAVKKVAKTAEKAAEEARVAEVEVPYPPVWSAESGISQKHFEEIYGFADKDGNWHAGKITGILSRQNKAFEEWNAAHPDAPRTIEVKDPSETYKDMMNNLVKARNVDPELFAGKTNDQVMYQYIKLVEYSEKAKNGPIVNGIHTLITRTDDAGTPLYASNQDEMQAMFKMLRCGEKVEISADALNANLDRIDMNTGKGIGDEFSALVTNNSFWGYGEDCNNGVSMWRRGINAVKKIFTSEPEPKTTQVEEVVPDDANVRSVQVGAVEAEDANVQAVYANANVTVGRAYNDQFNDNFTDEVAQQGKRVGSSFTAGKATKIEDATWVLSKKGKGIGD